jgi:hypothetical protein
MHKDTHKRKFIYISIYMYRNVCIQNIYIYTHIYIYIYTYSCIQLHICVDTDEIEVPVQNIKLERLK